MTQVLDLTHRNKGQDVPSLDMPMQETDRLSIRDIALTAAVVIPASMVWVLSERLLFAALLGVFIYLLIEYSYPVLNYRKSLLQPLVNLYTYTRDLVRTRVVRGA